MLYELTINNKDDFPKWENGVSSIPAKYGKDVDIGIPILKGVNSITFGVTGTGKTCSFTLPAAKKLLIADSDMMGVFFETKKTFLDAFKSPGDKVIVHGTSVVDSSSLFRWNLIKEIRQSRDPEAEMMQIAEILFNDLLSGADNNRGWVESARNTFIAVLRVIVYCSNDDTSNWTLINALRRMSIEELLSYLAKHKRNHSLLNKDFGYDVSKPEPYQVTRRAGDIMFFFNQVLEKFSGSFESDGTDTIYDYLHGKYGRNLFLLHDLATAEINRPFFLYFLKKIKDEKMSLSSDVSARMLWVLDEADKLADGGKSADFGLFQAATLGRGYNLQILLTTQSYQSLFGLAPQFNEHITEGGLAGFPVVVSFRPGDPKTITTLQTLFGSKRKIITTMPASRYERPIVKSEMEPLVSEADFASLDTGECYIKIKSEEPFRVSIVLEQGDEI